ncbi:MAG: homoserine dehydrogenase [Clostridia bacterium]
MKVAILGLGVVGSGTFEVITQNREIIKKNTGIDFEVKYIVDIRDFSGTKFEKFVINDIQIALDDPEVSVVAEVIGGATFAYDFTKRALLAGKHVVTSNKELVATHGTELLAIAKEKGVNYMFEASVGGGIPIIRPMLNCLAANEITAISGIVNGTTNYILAQMIDENKTFETALKEAQELGYAEKDPTADVCGIDAQRKICILSDVAFKKEVNPDEVYAEGITKITLEDVAYAEKSNKVIKLLARMIVQNGQTFAFVAPHFVSKKHMLSGVDGVFNAVMVTGNMVDDVMFYGKGAGQLATASAVVADIIDSAKYYERADIAWTNQGSFIADYKEFVCQFFVKIENTQEIPFDNVENLSDDSKNEVAFITEEMSVAQLENILNKFEKYSYIRVL